MDSKITYPPAAREGFSGMKLRIRCPPPLPWAYRDWAGCLARAPRRDVAHGRERGGSCRLVERSRTTAAVSGHRRGVWRGRPQMRARLVVGAGPELPRGRVYAFFKKVSDKPDGPCHHAQAADDAWRNSQF